MFSKNTKGNIINAVVIFGIVAFIGYFIISRFVLSSYLVPSNSMEPAILPNDRIWVNKIGFCSYFSLWGKGFKIPGFKEPQRGNVVVFHFPEGDSVLIKSPFYNVYELRAEGKLEKILRDTQDSLIYLPIKYRPNYVKRIVGLPGDTIIGVNKKVYYNGKKNSPNYDVKHLYKLFGGDAVRIKIDISDICKETEGYIVCSITNKELTELLSLSCVDSIEQCNNNRTCGYYFPEELDNVNRWNTNEFGPIIVPKKGKSLDITSENLPYYRRIISIYENNLLCVKNDSVFVNGVFAKSYTPKQDYYFVMGDNRDLSIDSRNWGFVPYDHIIGLVFCN